MKYFELPSPSKNIYIQCTSPTTFVVKKCAHLFFWNQQLSTCTIEQPIETRCSSFPCQNGGQCQDFANDEYKCICKTGFVGDRCEKLVDFCSSSPCLNNGKCVSYLDGYNCFCENKVVDSSCESGNIFIFIQQNFER